MFEPLRGMPPHRQLGDLLRLVGRVVQDLDLEQVPRIVHLADGVDQPVRDVHLVEDRQLDGDARQVVGVGRRQRLGGPAACFSCKDKRGNSGATRRSPKC